MVENNNVEPEGSNLAMYTLATPFNVGELPPAGAGKSVEFVEPAT